MLAVVTWQCLCGMNVKVMYETGRVGSAACPRGANRGTRFAYLEFRREFLPTLVTL